ncbi:MFS transporter [Chloroflexota bacterium]
MPSSNKRKLFYGWYMVLASWILVFLISSVAVSLFFKPMLEEFGWDRATQSSIQAVGLIVFTIASPFIGRFIDRFGPRAIVSICVGTQVLSNVINGAAGSLWHLYIARILYSINVLQGTQILVNRWFIKKRGMALAIMSTGMPLGTMILVPLSQYLILSWGWRTTMFFWAAVALAVMLPLALLIKNGPESKGLTADGEEPDSFNPQEISGGDTAGTGSSVSEAVRTKSFWFMSIAHFICGTGCGFIMTHLVIFATDMGYPDMIAASLVSVQGGLNLAGLLITGYLSDRMARNKVLALTHFVRSLSFAVVVVFILSGAGSSWMLFLGIGLFGFGWYTTAPLQAGLVADLFGNRRMGTILGLETSCHMLGMAAGAYLGGALFEITGSYFHVFAIQGGLELAAVFLFLAVKQKRVTGGKVS